jgi:membrane-bound metal-dependent hydrolase YbcI (DUF457 family)
MNKEGHWGAAALISAPFTALVVLAHNLIPALILLGYAVGIARLPDQFETEVGLEHRSWGHTVWFALACSAVPIAAAMLVSSVGTAAVPINLEYWLLLVGVATFLSLLSHLLADIITRGYVGEFDGYIRPFYPIRNTGYLLHWTKAGNALWNLGLLSAGVAVNVALIAVLAVSGVVV